MPKAIVLRSLCLLAAIGLGVGCDSQSGGPAGGGASGAKRLILLTNGNSPFWDTCRAGMRDAEEKLGLATAGLRAVMEVNDGTPQGQLDKLRQFGSQGDVAGVAVSALDARNAAVAQQLENLKAKGIHVVTVDADVDREKFRSARSYYIGTDNLTGGRELGTALRGLLEARKVTSGGYVQFVGRTGSHNAIERMDGLNEKVGEAYKEVDRMADDTDPTRARENVRNALRNHKDLVALVGIWSYNAPAIVDVVKQLGVRDQTVISVFDAEPLAISHMGDGFIDVMIVQNPFDMGFQAMRLLKAMHEGDEAVVKEMFPNAGKPDGDIFDTGLKVVVPDESSPLKADMFGPKTQFLMLAEFKKWLDSYGLKGS